MFRFRLEVDGEVLLDRGIARFSEGVGDFRPVWPSIADEFHEQVRDQFKTEGEEGGQRWQELSAEYAGWKEAHFPGKPILQRTGDLEKSLTSAKDPNAVYVAARKTLTLGSKVPYGIYHQSPKPRTVLPRRPMIVLTERFKRHATREMQAYLVEMATQLGFRSGLGTIASSKLGSIFGKGISPRGTSPRRTRDGILVF